MKSNSYVGLSNTTIKPGYIYVLIHPSDPNLYKIGKTVQDPLKRLAQHNNNHNEYAGQLVKETGQKWEIKTYIEVLDPTLAESAFWGATPFVDIPFLGGIEIQKMEWEDVQNGLDAAKKVGIRSLPQKKYIPDHVYAYTKWMKNRLRGRDITLMDYVKSKCSGKARFKCCNGHEWKTWVRYVAYGEGCPTCKVGERSAEEMLDLLNLAHLELLINPNKPGFIKISLRYLVEPKNIENFGVDEGWVTHRYRDVEEDPELAEVIIWELLGVPKPINGEPIKMALDKAEGAFRQLIDRLREKIALLEKEK